MIQEALAYKQIHSADQKVSGWLGRINSPNRPNSSKTKKSNNTANTIIIGYVIQNTQTPFTATVVYNNGNTGNRIQIGDNANSTLKFVGSNPTMIFGYTTKSKNVSIIANEITKKYKGKYT